ncbi:MAG: molybdenum ABC transporter ATP-binding protein [Geminicoccaceae bacterium]
MSGLEVDVAGRVGSFEVEVGFASDGGVTALFGHSGAGKTTVVNMIGGLVRPRRGRIVVGGRVLFDGDGGIDLPPHRRRLGHVFQEGRLFPHLSVRHNLLYGRWFRRAADDPRRFQEVVELLGIGHLLQRRPRSLSGGERQRVAIGRALLCDPAALLMDEPLASLDAPRKAEILPYLERLRDQARLPIVYVSHSIDEVARLARTMILMSDGRVAAAGPVAQIMTRLDLRPMTGRFEAGVVIEAEVESHDEVYQLTTLRMGGQRLTVPRLAEGPGARVRLRVRARDVALATERPMGISIQNVLPGRVSELSREQGPFVEANVEVEGTVLTARLTRRAADAMGLAPGRPVFALIKTIALDRVARLDPDGAHARNSKS